VTAGGLGGRIRSARLAAGLEQAQLGELLGVGQSAVSQWESNTAHPNGPHVVRLVEVLGPGVLGPDIDQGGRQ
jgi:transcriptional regulator with XRE-family HTH domain